MRVGRSRNSTNELESNRDTTERRNYRATLAVLAIPTTEENFNNYIFVNVQF